ncbi:MAG: hypothetical protein EOO28_13235 [Comamonadaceae bacterium]|nr:MAG: hypothetical protein EOO28_13235 [Comamonadaceae bacterium]
MPTIRNNLQASYKELRVDLRLEPVQNGQNRLDARLDEIRLAMGDSLGDAGCSRFPALVRRIGAALDAPGLWYLRSPLMVALCGLYGEEAARRKIESISTHFDGLLPSGLHSRPSPLDH